MGREGIHVTSTAKVILSTLGFAASVALFVATWQHNLWAIAGTFTVSVLIAVVKDEII